MPRGSRSIRHRQVLLLAGLLALVALAGCEGATPRPQVCHGCSDTGAVRGLPSDASVGESTAHLYLGHDGRPRIVARTELDAETVATLRRNESLRRDVRQAVVSARDSRQPPAGGPGPTPTPYAYYGPSGGRTYPVPAFAATDLSVRPGNGTLLVSFRVADTPGRGSPPPLARDGIGESVLVDRFHVLDGRNPHPENGEPFPYLVETDRLVVHAPPGTHPVVAPADATVREESVVLTSLPADTYLVFAPPGPAGVLTARATLTADALAWIVPGAFPVALLPAVQFGLVLAGLRLELRGGTRYVGLGVGLALLAVFLPLLALLGTIGLVALGACAVAAVVLVRRPWASDGDDGGDEGDADDEGDESDDGDPSGSGWSDRWDLPETAAVGRRIGPWLGPAAGATLIATVATLAVAAGGGRGPSGGLLLLVGGLLPVTAFGGLGLLRTVDRDRPRQRRALVLSVLVAPWLFAVGHVTSRTTPDGLDTVVLVVGWGIGATLVGVVVHRLAANAGRASDPGSESGNA